MITTTLYNFKTNAYSFHETAQGVVIDETALSDSSEQDTNSLIVQGNNWVEVQIKEKSKSAQEKLDSELLFKLFQALNQHLNDNANPLRRRIARLIAYPIKRYFAQTQQNLLPRLAEREAALNPSLANVLKALEDLEAQRLKRVQDLKQRLDQLLLSFESATQLLFNITKEKAAPEKVLLQMLKEAPVIFFDDKEAMEKIFRLIQHLLTKRSQGMLEEISDRVLSPYQALGEAVEGAVGLPVVTTREALCQVFNILSQYDVDLCGIKNLILKLNPENLETLEAQFLDEPLKNVILGYKNLKAAKDTETEIDILQAFIEIGDFISPALVINELSQMCKRCPFNQEMRPLFFQLFETLYLIKDLPQDLYDELLGCAFLIDQDLSQFQALFRKCKTFTQVKELLSLFEWADHHLTADKIREQVLGFRKYEETLAHELVFKKIEQEQRQVRALKKRSTEERIQKLKDERAQLKEARKKLSIFNPAHKKELKEKKEEIKNLEKELLELISSEEKEEQERAQEKKRIYLERWQALKTISEFLPPKLYLQRLYEITSLLDYDFDEATQTYLKLFRKIFPGVNLSRVNIQTLLFSDQDCNNTL